MRSHLRCTSGRKLVRDGQAAGHALLGVVLESVPSSVGGLFIVGQRGFAVQRAPVGRQLSRLHHRCLKLWLLSLLSRPEWFSSRVLISHTYGPRASLPCNSVTFYFSLQSCQGRIHLTQRVDANRHLLLIEVHTPRPQHDEEGPYHERDDGREAQHDDLRAVHPSQRPCCIRSCTCASSKRWQGLRRARSART